MKRIIALVLVLVMVLSLVACGNKTEEKPAEPGNSTPETPVVDVDNNKENAKTDDEESTGPKYGGSIRIVNTAEGSSELGLPWAVMNSDGNASYPCFESLVFVTNAGEVEPQLATAWDMNMEEKSITWTLREGVKFHDGSDFNAESAAWNIEQWATSNRMSNFDRVEVVGDYQVKMYYTNWSNTCNQMSGPSFCFASMKQALEKGMEYAAANPCGTGPFKFGEYVRGQKVIWVRNDDYWQEGKPYLDSIEFVFMTDATTKSNAMKLPYEEGGIDILNVTDAYQTSELMKLDSVYVNFVDIGPIALYPDSDNPDSPLSDLRVRQAVSYAIDREALCAARGYGIYKPGLQLVSPAWECFLDDPKYNCTYDKQKALDLLAEAGYPNGFDIDLWAQPNFADKDIMVAVQAMLGEVGINVNLQFPESGGYTDIKMNGWTGMLGQMWRNLPNIQSSFVLWFDGIPPEEEGGEWTHFWMPSAYRPEQKVHELEQAAAATETVDNEKVEAILQCFMEEMLAIPVYYTYDAYVIKNRVHDSAYGFYSFVFKPADVWVDDAV